MTKSLHLKKCIAVWAVTAFFSFYDFAAGGVLSPELERRMEDLDPGEKVPVIVALKDGIDPGVFRSQRNRSIRRSKMVRALRSRAQKARQPLAAFMLRENIRPSADLWLINGVALKLRAPLIRRISALPFVEEVRLDRLITLGEPLSPGDRGAEWNIAAIRALELWDLGIRGEGVVVASMDTGVDPGHLELISRWRGGGNSWFDPNNEHPWPYDRDGHGTQVMGLMVAGTIGETAAGIAPGARWIAAKIFNDAGEAFLSGIHQGFQWLLDPDGDPDTDDAPDVVNNSWGLGQAGVCNGEFAADIEILKAAGIGVVFAAGNSGPLPQSSVSPADNPGGLATGALKGDLTVALSSSRGPSACDNTIFPELTAPGIGVKTADLTLGGLFPDSYTFVSGASFAAPHVAGAMALLIQAFPEATPEDLEGALLDSALDLGPPGPDNDYGYGMVDVAAAYQFLMGCTDADGDGFFAEPGCAAEIDCDDGDGAVYPGAVEIRKDRIDQDCNGYDLTIEILAAQYLPAQRLLRVVASSTLGEDADLILDGHGTMEWWPPEQAWTRHVRIPGEVPACVTVSGVEGSISEDVLTQCTDMCPGDLDRNGRVDTLDLAVFSADFRRTDCRDPGSCRGDLNADGKVDVADLSIFAADFGRNDCLDCNQ